MTAVKHFRSRKCVPNLEQLIHIDLAQRKQLPLYGGEWLTQRIQVDTSSLTHDHRVGIAPKVTQSVITAAFLFAFKDALYDMTIKARRSLAAKR